MDIVRPLIASLNRLPGVRVTRNANLGPCVPRRFYTYLQNTGRPHPDMMQIESGLGEGSADIVGLVRVSFTDPKTLATWVTGRAFCLEVKLPQENGRRAGVVRDDQERWLSVVRRMGGFAAVVRSVEEGLSAVDRCRAGESGE